MTTARETVVGQLEPEVQVMMVGQARDIIRQAPLHRPTLPSGKPMHVLVTAAGDFMWTSDEGGYRYVPHDHWGHKLPPMPAEWRELASRYAPEVKPAWWDSAIINWYGPDGYLTEHVDVSEADTSLPVVTHGFGDSALWLVRPQPTQDVPKPKRTSTQTDSGAVTLLAGPTRDYSHGIERIIPAPMFRSLCGMTKPGRLSITIRVAGERA